jgi:hypothetical protein
MKATQRPPNKDGDDRMGDCHTGETHDRTKGHDEQHRAQTTTDVVWAPVKFFFMFASLFFSTK